MYRKDYYKDYYQKHKEKYREYGRIYIENHKEEIKKYARENAQKLRTKVLTMLGNKCVKCGIIDTRVLQIDHVYGGGKKERKKYPSPWTFFNYVIKKIQAGSKDYQLLCANCNYIKRLENKKEIN